MRVVTEIRHVDNPLNWYYGACGESTLLLDSFMHQLHVGDKVLIVSATGDITTSFVVHPDPQICHYVLEDLSKCNPFIMGIKGMSSKKLLGRNIEKYFGITAYDIDKGVMSQDPKIFEIIRNRLPKTDGFFYFRLIPYDKCKENERSTHGLTIATISDQEFKARSIVS